jgi:hypothetical protein
MHEMRAHHALALEADLLGDTLRPDVVGVRDELEPADAELVDGPA